MSYADILNLDYDQLTDALKNADKYEKEMILERLAEYDVN